jgi:hypothetical protein
MSALRQAWQGDDDGRGCDSAETYHGEASAGPYPGSWKDRADRGEGGQRSAVDQPEHYQGQGQCSHAGGAARVAADDCDPHRIVEAAGENDTDEGGPSVAGREGKHRRPLVRLEQPAPAQCFQRLGAEEEQRCRDEHTRVSA